MLLVLRVLFVVVVVVFVLYYVLVSVDLLWFSCGRVCVLLLCVCLCCLLYVYVYCCGCTSFVCVVWFVIVFACL